MPNKLVIDAPLTLVRERARQEYERAVKEFSAHPVKSQADLLGAFLGAIRRFFSTLGRPSLTRRRLLSPLEPPSSQKMNDTLADLSNDIEAAYTQQTSTETAVVNHFNYFQTERIRLETALAETRSLAEDYSIFSKAVDSKEIWFRDSFTTTHHVDLTFGTSSRRAHIDTDAGAVVLPKLSESKAWESIQDFEAVSAQHNLPEADPESYRLGVPLTRLTADKLEARDHYQGKMYGLVTPEGPVTGEDGIRVDESDVFSDVNPLLKAVDAENDPNFPVSFWEYEIVALEASRVVWSDQTGGETSYRDVPRRDIGTGTSVELAKAIEVKDLGLEFSPGRKADGYAWNQNGKINAQTDYPLEISLVFTFKQPHRVNAISITPNTFGKRAYPVITGITTASVSSTDPGTLVSLPQFQGGTQYRLNPDSVGRSTNSEPSLSRPYRFEFPARTVKTVVIALKQDTAYPLEYTLALASRNWTIKETKDGGWFHRDKTKRYEVSKFLWVDFMGKGFMHLVAQSARVQLETQLLERRGLESVQGSSPLERVAAGTGLTIGGAALGAEIGALLGPAGAGIGFFVGLIGGFVVGLVGDAWNTVFGGKITKEIEKVEDLFLDDRFNGTGLYDVQAAASNRWRYAVGVQDIGLFTTTYAESGEIVSQNYFSPEPIGKIALEVDEVIPNVFPKDRSWTDYFLSLDDGASWVQVNPLSARERLFPDDSLTYIPKIVHVNSDIPLDRRRATPGGERAFVDLGRPAYRARLRALLRRPETIEDQTEATAPQHFTPALNSYGIRILPKERGRDR